MNSPCRSVNDGLSFPRFSTDVRVTPPTPPTDAKWQLGPRLLLTGLASVGLSLLITARWLEPDPRGYGTHEQLGLTPCSFHQWTGYGCPACGTTTAWSLTLRGQVRQAISVHLGGALLCAGVLVAVPWLFGSALAGRWLGFRPTLPVVLMTAAAWLGVAMLDWIRRWYLS